MKVRGLQNAIRKHKRFNREEPRKLFRLRVDLSTPFIKIGPVPVITYLSKKEGKLRAYKHETKRPPTLYWNPKAKIGLLVGGTLKVDDWLYN